MERPGDRGTTTTGSPPLPLKPCRSRHVEGRVTTDVQVMRGIGDQVGDRATWFHKPFRADDGLMYYQDTPFAGRARGLARGQVFTREGDLLSR
ncbi:hypothetical protein [Actinomadura oligospora]|uniref:hypothetical protein n=1 Tax=Actinomadura oligospora TaxID=111804 RepID=UPI003CCC42D5